MHTSAGPDNQVYCFTVHCVNGQRWYLKGDDEVALTSHAQNLPAFRPCTCRSICGRQHASAGAKDASHEPTDLLIFLLKSLFFSCGRARSATLATVDSGATLTLM